MLTRQPVIPSPTTPPYNPEHEPPPLPDVIQRGMAATRLLGDPTLAEAFAAIRRDNYQDWLLSAPEQPEKRELLYREAEALERVRDKLVTYVAAAKLRQGQEAA